jgi:glycosyltransferase involved in cell wall biosynthesis
MSSASDTSTPRGVSVVIPAFNECGAIEATIAEVREALAEAEDYPDSEIIVVDDGSSDGTADLAEAAGARVIRQPHNRGYGASLKMGFAAALYDKVVITDADGTYPSSEIPAMLKLSEDYEMIVGARIGENVAIPLVRRPAKWVLRMLASYLAGRPIPDLNSGLRVIDRALEKRFEHLLPSGFSFTTTITLAALCNDRLVHYHPIDYYARIGESKIKATHAFDFLLLVLRTVVYFNPLKVFLPLGGIFFALGGLKFIYDLFIGNLSETALLGFIGGALLWSVGLLSDQIARVGLSGGRQ